MALGEQILMSVEWPAVTNARANGDGGLDIVSLVLPSVLTSILGLGWSKDNLRTADKCYVPGLYPNGTVKWPCGSINKGEGTSGQFKMQTQQTILAALSMGPVGISDQLSDRPEVPTADITSNVPLVMSTCDAAGNLLQPSFPLAPIERMIVGGAGFGDCTGAEHRAYTYGCGGHVWATYSSVEVSNNGNISMGIWFTSIGFAAGRGQLPTNMTVYEEDFSALYDQEALPASLLNDIPRGAFQGNGDKFPSGVEYVLWESDFLNQKDCSTIEPAIFNGNFTMPLPKGDLTSQFNLAPLYGGIALLGELSKVTAVSPQRFEAVAPDGESLSVKLRSKPAENVTLAYVVAFHGGLSCKTAEVSVGADGSATAELK